VTPIARSLVLFLALLAPVASHATQTVNGITINEDVPQAERGTVYSHTIVPTGRTAPYAFAPIGASGLPLRLTLSPGGVLSGVISCAEKNGTNKQDIRITDSSGPPFIADFTGNAALKIEVTKSLSNTCQTLVLSPTTLPAFTTGSSYSQIISVTNGVGPFGFAVTAGALPAGVTLNPITGQLGGTPTAAGAFSFTVTATDAADSTGTVTYSGSVIAAISINPVSLSAGTVGTAYSQTVSATGGSGSFTYAVSAGALPPGLTLNASTGLVSGTPTAAGPSTFTVRATDGTGATGSRSYSVTMAVAPIVVNPASLSTATVGTAYSQTVTATGGTGGFTYSVSAGALPAGLTLNTSSGALSGTPTTVGTSNFTIRATDSASASGTRAYSVSTSAAITVNPVSLPVGTVGTAYSRTFTATGGASPYTYSVSAGVLPAGLSLNASTGVLAGTPTATVASLFTIQVTGSNGAIGTRAYSITINPAIVVNPATLPGGTLGTAYSQTVTATGGTGAYTYIRSAGSLPAGLALNATTGAITGTPTASGTRTFTIRATDGNGAIGTRTYSVTIGAAIVVNPATLPGGTVASTYNRTVSATGGTGAKTFSISAGALPAGLSLNATTGVILGTPTSAGTSSFTVRATDTIGAMGSRAYTVAINPAITLSPTSLPNGTSGTPYSRTITASGGTGTFTYSVSAGSLGGGLTLNASTGVISGTPTTAGTRSFTIRATDGNGTFASLAYTITINAAIAVSPTSLANGTMGTPYSRTISATGGSGSYTYSISAGSLPAGLTLNASSGAISGTPTAVGASPFTIRATDSNGVFGSRAYTVTIAAAPVVVNPATLPGGAVGAAYSQVVSATGGSGSFTFSVSAGSLPAGLSLTAATGTIAGTPTAAGLRTFTIRATAGNGATGTRSYSVRINAAIVVNPASLAGGTAGTPYSQTITATGGSGGYTYSLSAGTLPAGLTLNPSNGAISGTPITGGTSALTIRATDSNGAAGTRAYTVTIAPAPITLNPPSLPGATVGSGYAQTVAATGGTGSYSFNVSAGTLPAGLTLSPSSGVISGTPTAAGVVNFTIRATDGSGGTGLRAYTITVASAPIAVSPVSLPGGTVGVAYSQVVTATGGIGGFTYSVSAGALPAGLSLNAATGAIAGTPTNAAPSSFTIRATDSGGSSGTHAYILTMNAAITVNPASLPNGTVGAAYSQAVTASGGNGSFTYSVSAGSLPAGLSLNPSSGLLSGTPTSAATSSFTVTATDGNSVTGSRAYSVTIAAGIAVNPATLPGASVGTPYSPTISATGGTGTYAFSVTAGALPAGLSLNPSTGAITGTPTTAATSNFTVTATDGNGATGSRAFSFVVNGAMAVNPATLPNGTEGTAYSQTVSATGGNGSYTFSVTAGALPAGLTLNASTGALTGTPSTASSSNFTLTAVDGTGATASRAYTVMINAALSLNPPTLPNGTVGTAYDPTLVTTGGNGTYTYGITSGSLPAGLALNASTGALTGTPTAAATSDFTVTVTDGLGATASRAYSVEVAPAALTLESTNLGNGVVGNPYNQAIVVSGGVAPYAFSISSGQLPTGVSLNPATGALSGTPITAGTYSFTIRVVDTNGATGAFAQSIVVEPRLDPTADPTVRGMLAAQVSAASRFGSAQIENVGARVRMLHFGQDPCSMQFDVGTNAQWEHANGSVDDAKLAAAPTPEQDAKPDKRTRCDSPFAFWAGGNIDFGFLRPNSATDRSDFTTSGLTFGADARVTKGLVLGAAVGYGRDSTDVGTNESESHAQGVNATVYGSYEPIKSLYIDFLLGYGDLSLDATRFNGTAMMLGGRNGAQTFGSVGVSGIVDIGRLKLAPYGRFDRVRSRLDGYTESGPSGSALGYADVTAIEDVCAAGLFASYRIPLGRASLEPNLRIEARRARGSSADQTLWYADLPTTTYVIADGSMSDTQMLGGLGLVLRMAGESSLGIDYSYTGSSGSYRSESVRALLRAPF
jgi:hypothetical protein